MKKLIALLLLATTPAWALKVNGPLEGARLEALSSDPASGPTGRIIYNTTEAKAKIHTGSSFVPLGSGSGAGGLYAGGQNLIVNNSWEVDASGWTPVPTGGYTRNVLAGDIAPPGVGSGKWITLAGDVLLSPATTITSGDGISGQNGAFSCAVKTTASTFKLQAWNGSAVLGEATIAATGGVFKRYTVNAPFPASGTTQIRFLAGAGGGTLFVDDCYLGLAEGFNLMQVSQAEVLLSASRLTSQAIGTSAPTPIVFNSAAYDPYGKLDTSTGSYAITKPGSVTVAARVGMSAIDAGGFYLIVQKTGADVPGCGGYLVTGSGTGSNAVGPCTFSVVPGDTVRVTSGSDSDASYGIISGLATFSILYTPGSAQTAITPDKTFDATGQIMTFAGTCPANTIPADGKVLGLSSGDFQGATYYRLYSYLWALPGLCAHNGSSWPTISIGGVATACNTLPGYVLSGTSAKGASAAVDWAAGRTITVDRRNTFSRMLGTNNPTLGAYQADDFKLHGHGSGAIGYLSGVTRLGSGTSDWWVDNTLGVMATGGPETRPKAVTDYVCINHTGAQAGPVILTGNDVSVLAKKTTSGPVPNATYTTVVFDSVSEVIGGAFDGSVFTASVAGRYRIASTVEFIGNAIGDRYLAVALNGTTDKRIDARAGSAAAQVLTGSTTYRLMPGQTMAVQVYQNSGGPLTFADGGAIFNYISIERIGN